MKTGKTKLMIITALFTALTAVCTAFVSIPMPSITGGYIHFGDALVFLASAILPTPYALFVGAIGSSLGDVITQWYIYIPFTFIIKGTMTLFINSKGEKLVNLKNILGLIPCSLVIIGGYYLAEVIICQNFVAPIASIIGNVIQAVGSGIIFVIFAFALDKFSFKNKVLKVTK